METSGKGVSGMADRARVLVLGAGFGGLEVASRLSGALGERADVTLIDQGEGFVFGYSKLDLLFGRKTVDEVQSPFSSIAHPGVRFLRATITAIDPGGRRVMTSGGVLEGDFLVVALGADLDPDSMPGMETRGGEFYSVAGAIALHPRLDAFQGGDVVIGAHSFPFKCPPAPSECALLLHDHLTERGLRSHSTITLVLPMPVPVPPSPETSVALLDAFEDRGIRFLGGSGVRSVDDARGVAVLENGLELPCDLFLGIPRHAAPAVVRESGLAEGDWVPVDPRTLRTRFEGVYAIGDLANTGTPKAGVFAEGAGRAVASAIAAAILGEGDPEPFDGTGSCYIEFGDDRVSRVDVDAFSGPRPVGVFRPPSREIREDKAQFGSIRRARWFGG